MEKTRESSVDGAAYGPMRFLGRVMGVSFGVVRGVGRFISGSAKILTWFSRGEKRPTRKAESQPEREGIRSIIIEELARLQGAEGEISLSELEKRLRLMAEAIEGLQERIAELGTRGSFSEADMWEAMGSLEAAESLTNDEKALLVSVFRQNIALQKPELIGAGVEKG